MNRSSIARLAIAMALALPAAGQATELWHLAPGEAGFTEHPAQVKGPMTREQTVARDAEEAQRMAARGLRWNQLYGVWQPVGAAGRPAISFTREQKRAEEAEEFRQMAAKGYRWNQLYSTYQYVGPAK